MTVDGYKTYIVGFTVLVAALVGGYFEVFDKDTVATLVSVALLSMGLRHGMSK